MNKARIEVSLPSGALFYFTSDELTDGQFEALTQTFISRLCVMDIQFSKDEQ